MRRESATIRQVRKIFKGLKIPKIGKVRTQSNQNDNKKDTRKRRVVKRRLQFLRRFLRIARSLQKMRKINAPFHKKYRALIKTYRQLFKMLRKLKKLRRSKSIYTGLKKKDIRILKDSRRNDANMARLLRKLRKLRPKYRQTLKH